MLCPGAHPRRPVQRKRPAVCLPPDVRSPAPRPKPICARAGITARLDWPSLRFHPSVWYRESEAHPREAWPALLAAVTDHDGTITGIQRSWLDRTGTAKAPIADPRRALGRLLGNGVRFGSASEPAPAQAGVIAAGEGVETMLALASVLPSLPLIAALSANHLAALAFAPSWRRLYVARDNDVAGRHAATRLHERGQAAGIEVRDLVPVHEDFNADLCALGPAALLAHLAPQLVPADLARFAADHARPGIASPSHGIAPEGGKPVRAGGGQPFSREQRAAPRPSRAAICRSRRAARKGAALIPGAMARGAHFPPPARKSGPALHREAKCFPAAILRVAAALRVRRVSVPGLGSP